MSQVVFSIWLTQAVTPSERLVASVWVRKRQHMEQTMSQVVFSVWLTQAVTLSRSAWWQVCGCMTDSTWDKPCPKWWLRSGNSLIRLHQEKRHCWIGKNERSLLEVLKTGRGVGEKDALGNLQRLPLPLNVPQWSWHGNDRQSLVCHGQQCKTTWRKTWMWGCIAQPLWMNCRMATWIDAMNRAMLCWTHSQMLYSAQRFFSVMNVPFIAVRATEMWCSGQRRIPISHRSWNIIHHMMIWVGMTSDYLIGPYFFDGPVNAASYLAMLETWLIPQLRDTRTPRWRVTAAWWGTLTLRSFCARYFERTFSRPLDWPWLTDISGTIAMATTQSWPYHTRQFVVGYYQGKSGCASLQQRRFAQSCGRRLSHNYSKNAPTYVKEDMEAHPFVSSIKVHIRMHWTCNQGVLSDSNHGSILVSVRWLLGHPVHTNLQTLPSKPTACD